MADEPKSAQMIPVEIEAEMKKSYLDYAMNDLGLASNRGYRKCAKICGDTSGNYHPHGEAVIYPTLVRLAQSFNMRYPLIDGQGNYGSVDGDPPAAMRYTEARLAKISEEILADLEKETVDFIPNFDQTREEPVVLPSRIPNLLVNGASGIDVGKDRENIVITEIPYQVNKSRLIERIAELVQTKKIEGIADVRDESDREGMRFVIEVKRGEEPKIILNYLFKLTQMQESFGMILLAIVNGQPRELGLLPLLKLFIEHRIEVVRRRTQFELRKAEEREHILLGFKKALEHLDDIIKLIRRSKSPKEAREGLMETWEFTERQAQAILDLQLHRLTQMEREKIIEELKQIQALIAELKEILGSEKKLKAVIIKELREVQKDYADQRRTEIVESVEEIKLEDLIANVEMAITVSHAGYIKRTPVDVYRHQSRGGKGRIGAKTREEDFVEHLFVASAHSYILLFSSKGRVYWLKVYEIPEAAAATRGKAISSLVKFQEDEHLTAVVAARSLEDTGRYVFFATRNGTVKKTELAEFSNPRPSGIIAITLEPKDELIGVKLTDGKQMIFLASHEGQAILFRETEVRAMGRQAGGVNGMDLGKDDYVVSMDAVQPDFEIVRKESKKDTQSLDELENEVIKDSLTSLMLSISEKGYGKRTPLAEYRITSRGGKGVINLKTTERNGPVVAALQVGEDSDVMIITHNGKVIRVHANEIREAGGSTQGVRLLRLEDGDKIAAAASILEDQEVAEGAGGTPAGAPGGAKEREPEKP